MFVLPISSNEPSFGMAVNISSRTRQFLEKNLSSQKLQKFEQIIKKESNNPININLDVKDFYLLRENISLIPWTKYQNLTAEVEGRVFEENLFTTSFGVIDRAVKYARKLEKKARNLHKH